MTDTREMAWVDIRHVTTSESVACMAGTCTSRWATYALTTNINPQTLEHKPTRTYLCRACAAKFLVLADAFGVE